MIRVRASSLAELFDCPQRWKAKHIDGKRTKNSGRAALGTGVHAGTAVFDDARINGSGITADEAAGAVVDSIHSPEGDVDWSDISRKDAEKIALGLHAKYCAHISPQFQFAAVERENKPLVFDDLGISLTGTTDRLYLKDGKKGVADLKTGARAVVQGQVSTAQHTAQLGVYTLLSEFDLCEELEAPPIIIGMKTGSKPESQEFNTAPVPNAKSVLIGTDGEPGLLEMASHIIQNEIWFGNPKSWLCSEKFCPNYKNCKWR